MSKLSQIPYERVVAWLAPYIAIAAGALSTWLCTRIGLFSALGVSQTTLEHGLAVGVTGVLTSAAAYAAHHKWLDNLAKYWVSPAASAPAFAVPDVSDQAQAEAQPPSDTIVPDSARKPDAAGQTPPG